VYLFKSYEQPVTLALQRRSKKKAVKRYFVDNTSKEILVWSKNFKSLIKFRQYAFYYTSYNLNFENFAELLVV
jgi:hypothetical protein